MARRMFSDEIVASDAFLDMPSGSQLLYFHLGVQADDDGFISSPKMVMRMIGASEDELKILFAKKFLLSFDNGICVVKHWRINNYIRKDIYKETKYQKEKNSLFIRENGAYTFNQDNALPVPKGHFTVENINVDEPSTSRALSIGKVSIGKVSKDTIPFSSFWELYPKKVERKKSELKWSKLDIEVQKTILADLVKRRQGEKWLKDGGKYIEMPTTYLNGERWNDEIITPTTTVANKTHRI